MGMGTLTNTEAFAKVLGVTVIEVTDLHRECMIYDEDTNTVEVCSKLCRSQREAGFEDLLTYLDPH